MVETPEVSAAPVVDHYDTTIDVQHPEVFTRISRCPLAKLIAVCSCGVIYNVARVFYLSILPSDVLIPTKDQPRP